MKYTVSYSCLSHVGRIRKNNEDNFYCAGEIRPVDVLVTEPIVGKASPENGILFAVFDGMGGEEKGETASLIAAGVAESCDMTGEPLCILSEICTRANGTVCDYAKENGGLSMGTTAAMLHFSNGCITLCNIGDSRVFRLCRGKLSRISRDHLGVCAFQKKPPLSQYLGISEEGVTIEPYFSVGDVMNGDRYLICTDGLTDHVSEEDIADILSGPVSEAAERLTERALSGGGKDNITVIAIEIKRNKLFDIFRKGE